MTTSRTLRLLPALIAVAMLGLSAPVTAAKRTPRPEPLPKGARFDDAAAPSIDALVGKLLAALAANDRTAVTRLLVSEDEYIDIIVPGNVAPGQPPARMPRDIVKFYWDTLNLKSLYSAQNLLNEFGGRTYTVKQIQYAKGQRTYAWFTGYQQLRITVVDEQGVERELQTGSAAEVRGRFKFVSFVRD